MRKYSYYLDLYYNTLGYYDLDSYDNIQSFFSRIPFNYKFDSNDFMYSINYNSQSEFYEKDGNELSAMALPLTNILRGAVFEKGSNYPLCLPLPKFSHKTEFFNIPIENLEFTEAIDGALVNLFYYKDVEYGGRWMISTRGRVNAFNSRWRSELNFGEMTAEAMRGYNFNLLDKNCCYSLVLEYPENVNVIIHHKPKVYHIFTRDMTTYKEVRNDYIGIPKPRKHIFFSKKMLDLYLENCKLNKCKGVVARNLYDNRRCIYYTNAYEKMKSLVKNHQNIRDIFIDNYSGIEDSIKNIRHILKHYEDKEKMNEWTAAWKWVLHAYTGLINEIEFYYETCYKRRKRRELPGYLKPILYEIHGLYIARKREWYRVEELRKLTEVYYKGDIESNPSPKIKRYDIAVWFAGLPFERRREILYSFFNKN